MENFRKFLENLPKENLRFYRTIEEYIHPVKGTYAEESLKFLADNSDEFGIPYLRESELSRGIQQLPLRVSKLVEDLANV